MLFRSGLYNGNAGHVMYFGSDQYFQFLNRAGNYGPGVYAQDFYSNAAGRWMSGLCRPDGTNCPAGTSLGDWSFSGDNLISNGWGHIYTTSSNLHLTSYSGSLLLNYYYNNWVYIGNQDTGYLQIGNTQLYDDNDWFRIYSGANNRIYTNSYFRVDNNLEVNGNIY